jgi:hypothetical protein
MGVCGALTAFAGRVTGRSASDVSNAGQKTSAITATITTISTLATRVAFHATPGRTLSMFVLMASASRDLMWLQVREATAPPAVVTGTLPM